MTPDTHTEHALSTQSNLIIIWNLSVYVWCSYYTRAKLEASWPSTPVESHQLM